MQYSPKLKRVMRLLQDTLEQEGVAASIILHEPPYSEYMLHLKVPYSCAFLEGDYLRIRARREDFSSLEQQKRRVTDTINMLQHFQMNSANNARTFEAMLKKLHQQFIIEGGEPQHTGQSEIDN